MKIEKPDWTTVNGGLCLDYRNFDEWFQEKVEPVNSMFKDAVEFRCYSEPIMSTSKTTLYKERWMPFNEFPQSDSKLVKTATLINIQEIKPKTREERAIELLGELVDRYHPDDYDGTDQSFFEIMNQAKQILEGE